MASHSAVVAFASLRSCLVNLPPDLTALLLNSDVIPQSIIIEITQKPSRGSGSAARKAFAGWSGFSSTQHDVRLGSSFVEVDPLFAKSLGLVEGAKVTLSIVVNPPVANVIYLEPATPQDWDIVDLHAQYLEANMLSQVRAVSTKQPLLVYLSSATVATLLVTKIEPPLPRDSEAVKISAIAEIIIAPKARTPPTTNATPNTSSVTVNGKPNGTTAERKRTSVAGSSRRMPEVAAKAIVLKAIALPHSYFSTDKAFEDANDTTNTRLTVYVDTDALDGVLKPTAQHALVSIFTPPLLCPAQAKPPAPSLPALEDPAQQDGKPYIASRIIVDVVPSSSIPSGFVALSPRLVSTLNISGGSVHNFLRIQQAPKSLSRLPRRLIIVPFADPAKVAVEKGRKLRFTASDADKLDETLRARLIDEYGILNGPIQNGMRLPRVPNSPLSFGGILEFELADGWILPPSNTGKPVAVAMKPEIVVDASDISETHLLHSVSNTSGLPRLFGIDDKLSLMLKAAMRGQGILLSGGSGSGKSAALQILCFNLDNSLIYNFRVQCAELSEERIPVVKDAMAKWFAEVSWYAPCVLILEDIDKLIPAELENTDSTRIRQLAELFTNFAKSTTAFRKASIVATASSKEGVHGFLITSHIFTHFISLKAPDKAIRKDIIAETLRRENVDVSNTDIDVLQIADKAEGYLPGDIMVLTARAKHESLIRTFNDHHVDTADTTSLKQIDFENALKDYVPTSLRGVNLQKSSVSWKDIGGLRETRRVLLETLEWPTKYAPIFENCPLRLRSGLLLYGYPGCGKTFLASAVAHECGLNFISIKGPEILNKYIGASEKSVRDLFDRAQAAKPCVLFFDEFDSIAPKRGHDSTGVTDRVVNQMLTQMDGAEGLEGVYVLAATSRPDLIDSALLRPGRIDKTLLCDMPSLDDRLDILRVLSRKMKLSDDISLAEIARDTEGYSPADLQALMYNAHLDAIHDIVDNQHDEKIEDSNSNSLMAVSSADEESPGLTTDFFQITYSSDSGATEDTLGHDASNGIKSALKQYSLKSQIDIALSISDASSASHESHPSNKISSLSPSLPQATDLDIIIQHSHIIKSLQSTQPSISDQERATLRAIYYEFVSGRNGEMPSGTASSDIGGRATLM
ncbi:P-loop containing nucleoside triphosphate hydrolase protein [Limtongia smithiae]|uniref:P-loop containing nucleoside triphosphate hydrolase protein n=1 Tax=Limtongia smithiae TaxID=1125753 RepID=UPI0034CF5ECF